jgi:hypothetical protein
MMQESGLEGRGRDLFGLTADSHTWCNTIPAETAPSAALIPNGLAGVGGSSLTNEYFNASWYELQILLNNVSHQHRDRGLVDWVYVISRYHDLYAQTHQPEPARLLVAIAEAMQSTDPQLGPDDYKEGWRPEQNIDPRIMISPVWEPIFKPLPIEIHRALSYSQPGWTRICNTRSRSTCRWVGCLRARTLLPKRTVTLAAETSGQRLNNFVMPASQPNSSGACSNEELHTPTGQPVSNIVVSRYPEKCSNSLRKLHRQQARYQLINSWHVPTMVSSGVIGCRRGCE